MGTTTKIGWTEATWTPSHGSTKDPTVISTTGALQRKGTPMNEAANAYAEAIYRTTDADGVLVTFDHTIIVTGDVATRYQNSAAMRRGLSAGTAEVGAVKLLPIQPGDEIDAPGHHDDQDVLNDNVRRRW